MARAAADDVTIAGVRLTHPEKVLYAEQGITKRELAAYYVAVADHILPHLAGRPITLVRCPTGRQRKCFYQRHAGAGVPPQLAQVEIPGFEEPYLFIKNTAGLVALVQMGVLEIHPWGAKVDRPDRPDRIVFDLDPGEGLQFADVVAAAHDVRDCLGRIGLTAFAKTTGGKGLHVVVPVARRHNWARIKAFAREVATAIAKRAPEHYLTRLSKAERRGRIFIDYLRNDPTATAVCPYSSRARTGAPVSTPLAWDEVAAGLDPASFTIRTVPDRLVRLGRDPWAEMASLRQGLPAQVAA
jgi:bifunctional non-homologous end joining protein LigD